MTSKVVAFGFLVLAACSSGEEAVTPELREGTTRITTRDQQVIDVSTTAPIKLGKNDLFVSFPPPVDAELVRASALMPAHGHGSQPPTAIAFAISSSTCPVDGKCASPFAQAGATTRRS